MVKRSRAERVARAGARTAGSGIGAALSSPFGLGALGLGALLVGIFIFKDKIAEAIGSIKLPFSDIEFPSFDFKFPDFKFPDITFPDFKFPDFSFDFPDFFGGDKPVEDVSEKEFELDGKEGMFGMDTTFDPNTGIIEGETPPTVDLGVAPSQLDPLGEISFNKLRSQLITSLINQGFDQFKVFERFQDVSFFDSDKPFKLLGSILEEFNPPADFSQAAAVDEKPLQDFTVGQSLGTAQVFTGGGVGFQGGFVSPTPITTLTQVLNLFPKLTASQAADFLGEFSGILPEAALLQGGDVINISVSPDDPPQIFNQTSLGISGTAESIFKLLFPNVKSNF